MYVSPNFKTKKALKEAVEAGKEVHVYLPGHLFSGPFTGTYGVEGPHSDTIDHATHRWYATVEAKEGLVKRIIK